MPRFGPWIQPTDRIASLQPARRRYSVRLVTDDPRTGPNYRFDLESFGQFSVPDPEGAPIDAAGPAHTGVGIDVGHVDYHPIEFSWGPFFTTAVVDLDAAAFDPDDETRAITMPPIPPPVGWDDDPSVLDYQYEAGGGSYLAGGFTLTLSIRPHVAGYWVDDINGKDTLGVADESLMSSTLQYRRLPSAAYTAGAFTGGLTDETAWPDVTALSGSVVADWPLLPVGTAVLTPFGTENNYLDFTDGVSTARTTTVHLDEADLDGETRLGLVFTLDRYSSDTDWPAPPYLYDGTHSDDPGAPYSGGMDWWSRTGGSGTYPMSGVWKSLLAQGDVVLTWAYRPPRYRFVYEGVVPLRQRQTSTGIHTAGNPLRQRQHHFGLRQRQTGI